MKFAGERWTGTSEFAVATDTVVDIRGDKV